MFEDLTRTWHKRLIEQSASHQARLTAFVEAISVGMGLKQRTVSISKNRVSERERRALNAAFECLLDLFVTVRSGERADYAAVQSRLDQRLAEADWTQTVDTCEALLFTQAAHDLMIDPQARTLFRPDGDPVKAENAINERVERRRRDRTEPGAVVNQSVWRHLYLGEAIVYCLWRDRDNGTFKNFDVYVALGDEYAEAASGILLSEVIWFGTQSNYRSFVDSGTIKTVTASWTSGGRDSSNISFNGKIGPPINPMNISVLDERYATLLSVEIDERML